MGNLTMSGANTVGGGEYNDVTMSGACRITSDTICNSFKCSGACKVEGTLECDSFEASGASKVFGKVSCGGLFKCSGATNVGGACVNKLRTSGAFSSGGSVEVKTLAKLSGTANIDGDLTSETIAVDGSISVKGDVNAESFNCEMSLSSKSNASTIGGSEVKIVRKISDFGVFAGIIRSIFGGSEKPIFTVDEIEADSIELEGVHARVVRGNDINIGSDCKIKRVEYTGKVTYADSAEIGELVEI